MIDWIILFTALVIFPLVMIWMVYLKGFIPGGEHEGMVVRVEHRTERYRQERAGRRPRTREITHWYPVVKVKIDRKAIETEAIIPDLGRQIVPGDRVRIIIGVNKNYCLIKGWVEDDA